MPVPLYEAKADLFRTLGHPARIRILELLCERPYVVHEFLDHVEIEASNLSQQLSVLRRAKMVVSTRRDGDVVYSVSVPEVRDLLLAGRRILAQMSPGVDLDWVPSAAGASTSLPMLAFPSSSGITTSLIICSILSVGRHTASAQ